MFKKITITQDFILETIGKLALFKGTGARAYIKLRGSYVYG